MLQFPVLNFKSLEKIFKKSNTFNPSMLYSPHGFWLGKEKRTKEN